MKPLLSMAMVATLAGCASMYPRHATFRFSLTEVSRPAQATQQYGPVAIDSKVDSGRLKFTFEDQLVRVLAFPTSVMIAVNIANKTDHSIRIAWDNAAIVSFDGQSMRVVTGEVTYATRSQPQPPSIIARKGHLTELLIPVDKLDFNLTTGTRIEPFLPDLPYTTAQASTTLALYEKEYDGKTIQLLLPLEIEGVTNEYLLTFTVKGVVAEAGG